MGQMSLRFATEVRHSLHSILGFLELVGEEPLSERQASYLAQCRNGADELLRIAADLWELSPLGPAPPALSVFRVEDAVREVVDLVRPFAERKGLILEPAHLDGSELSIEGAREIVQDTLRRILENALQYTERGRIRVSGGVRGEGETSMLILEVADSGDGIPDTVLARLRSDDDTLPEQGLSLAVVRRRMGRMKGEISVVSSPTGTTVRLTIPAPLASREDIQENATEGPGGTAPMRLLVVENSDDCYFVFQGYTSGEGYHLTRAHHGGQAIEMAKCGEYNLIVMDANMPRMDGYAATRAIREWESNTSRPERVPILLFSADDTSKQAKLGGAAGCSGYLAKPATKAEVLKALQFFTPRRRG